MDTRRWRIHDSPFQVSDGCYISNREALLTLQGKLYTWGVRNNHEIKGRFNNKSLKNNMYIYASTKVE